MAVPEGPRSKSNPESDAGVKAQAARDTRFLFGPLAALVFAVGTASLALTIPGYSHLRQTVSEIGEAGSRARVPFTLMVCSVAACLWVFARALRDRSIAARRSASAAYLTGCMAISAVGVGVFAYPHPLHNVFGLSELIGYQAPAALALDWRGDVRARTLVRLSWLAFGLVWLAILLNLSSLGRQLPIWAYVKPLYGLIQRALFAAWFGWCALSGVLMYLAPPTGPSAERSA